MHTTNDGPALGLGQVDATLEDYEGRGGLDAAALELPAERIVEELKAAGLSGYGGAGFPTGSQVGVAAARERRAGARGQRRRRASRGRSRTAT